MGGYAALYWAGFRRQSRYVASLAVGIAANVFFGIIRSALFVTLYRQRDQVAGLDITAVLTYVWILQVVFGVVFVTWIWEFADSVRSGDFAAELVKPGAVLGRLLAIDLGRSSFALATRGLPQLVLAGMVLDLRLPTTPPGVVMLALSLALCAVAASELRFLFGSLAFWTPDYRGWWTMLFGFLWFTGGFLVPVEFFPGALRWIGEHGPLAGLLAMPVRVATGRGATSALAVQACWVLVVAAACHAVMATAQRRMVIHGG